MEEKIKFKRKIMKTGDSKAVTLPEEILRYLNNPEEVYIMPETGKHGQYISIWNKKQQKE